MSFARRWSWTLVAIAAALVILALEFLGAAETGGTRDGRGAFYGAGFVLVVGLVLDLAGFGKGPKGPSGPRPPSGGAPGSTGFPPRYS